MISDYVELRTRSAFSFLEGASTPEDLAARAAELGYGALALGDRDGLYGAPRFHQAAKDAGIKPMVGAELTLSDESRLYVCLAGGPTSPLSRMVVRGEDPRPLCERLRALFGAGNLFIDLQRHLDANEERLNRKLAALAAACRVPLVASNDVCHGGADRQLLDVLTCIRLGTTLEEAGRRLWSNNQRHLKPSAEMAALFRDLPGAVAAPRALAGRCAFTPADMGYRFPDYPLPPRETPDSYLGSLQKTEYKAR